MVTLGVTKAIKIWNFFSKNEIFFSKKKFKKEQRRRRDGVINEMEVLEGMQVYKK